MHSSSALVNDAERRPQQSSTHYCLMKGPCWNRRSIAITAVAAKTFNVTPTKTAIIGFVVEREGCCCCLSYVNYCSLNSWNAADFSRDPRSIKLINNYGKRSYQTKCPWVRSTWGCVLILNALLLLLLLLKSLKTIKPAVAWGCSTHVLLTKSLGL